MDNAVLAHIADLPTEKLRVATVEFESQFIIGPAGNTAFAATGEPFLVCGQFGPIEEGSHITPMSGTDDAAIAAWKMAAMALFQITPNSVLYWRSKPEIAYLSARKKSRYYEARPAGWTIYSRFLISDKPIKELK